MRGKKVEFGIRVMQVFHNNRLVYAVNDAHVVSGGGGVYHISYRWVGCPYKDVEEQGSRDPFVITERDIKYRGHLTQMAKGDDPWVTITAKQA